MWLKIIFFIYNFRIFLGKITLRFNLSFMHIYYLNSFLYFGLFCKCTYICVTELFKNTIAIKLCFFNVKELNIMWLFSGLYTKLINNLFNPINDLICNCVLHFNFLQVDHSETKRNPTLKQNTIRHDPSFKTRIRQGNINWTLHTGLTVHYAAWATRPIVS